ncbi:hypothetical protein [Cyanobium sp. Morenito 9A2]|uniref:hypothetical protein n=1 Tax=Cyanobium sp. Morenito 9A2 TaxID=2823718 RepID=UPI0020CCFD4E|nr:hypothetical protein [Cyanobium sp. Morenito 9A2]MCP9850005.1 hypothetical protein [Cyanobium sp. Morenito 9A2]
MAPRTPFSRQPLDLRRWLVQPAFVALSLALPIHGGVSLAQTGPAVGQGRLSLSPAQRQELFLKRRALEQKSHAGRIAILQQADRCISAAQTMEVFKDCEQKENQARQQLRGQLRAEAAQVRAQYGLPPRPERGRSPRQGLGTGQQGV